MLIIAAYTATVINTGYLWGIRYIRDDATGTQCRDQNGHKKGFGINKYAVSLIFIAERCSDFSEFFSLIGHNIF
ncbi:hypothetical protein BB778_25080 [Pluralibacter gergoviae]|nr:hypothetical protein BB778_25080 [Pluralibacter gergoviae]